MCSLTFWPRKGGYLLGMNRDERRTRVSGLPPVSHLRGRRTVVHPSEPGGGTWISLNDLGVSLALLNAYSFPVSGSPASVSRGMIIRNLADQSDAQDLSDTLRKMPLTQIAPFRLFGCFPETEMLLEWRWTRSALDRIEHPWAPGFWSSSAFRESEAQRCRRATFEHRSLEPQAGTREWIRRLHASHDPLPGPFSLCMHRADASTVSYTQVRFKKGTVAEMAHRLGAPCQRCKSERVRIPSASIPRSSAEQFEALQSPTTAAGVSSAS